MKTFTYQGWLKLTISATVTLFGAAILQVGTLAHGQERQIAESQDSASTTIRVYASEEPIDTETSLKFTIDNDLFTPRATDRDYTGGFNISASGNLPASLASLNRPFKWWLDRRVGSARLPDQPTILEQDAVQFGLLVFTPDDLSAAKSLPDDRPYANLVYFGTASHALNSDATVLRQSQLIVGVLGSSAAELIQSAIHRMSDSDEPKGYDHQISDGGELTGQYAIGHHKLLMRHTGGRLQYDTKLSINAAVGYLTEASIGLGLRWGRIATPWWRSLSDYGDTGVRLDPPSDNRTHAGGRDLYVFAGIQLRARAYNALLQGQFRNSDVTLGSSDVNHFVTQTWLGLVVQFRRMRVQYALRHESAEIRRGLGSRSMTWAGITVTRDFR